LWILRWMKSVKCRPWNMCWLLTGKNASTAVFFWHEKRYIGWVSIIISFFMLSGSHGTIMRLKSRRFKCKYKQLTYFATVKFWWQNLDIKIWKGNPVFIHNCIGINVLQQWLIFFWSNTSINVVWDGQHCVFTRSHKYTDSEGTFFEKCLHVEYLNFSTEIRVLFRDS
jgi:hypothetical protein